MILDEDIFYSNNSKHHLNELCRMEFSKPIVIKVYDFLIKLRYFSSFFLTSSSNSAAVIPCSSKSCFFALSNSSCSVSLDIVCEHVGSPASLQFIDNVIGSSLL